MLPVDPGNIVDRGPEEHYVSSPFKLPGGAWPRKAWWDASLPPGTWVRMQLRFARSKEALDSSPWLGAEQEGGWIENGASLSLRGYAGCWMQYRLSLGAVNGGASPRVKAVNIAYE